MSASMNHVMSPVQVPIPNREAASVVVSSDDTSACALTTTGDLWCWGAFTGAPDPAFYNYMQVLYPPTQLGMGHVWTQIAVVSLYGVSTICGIDDSAALWCWGDNSNGQRGDNGAWRTSPVPVKF